LLITGPIVAPVFSSPFKRGEVNKEMLANIPAEQPQTSPASPSSSNAQFGIEEAPALNMPPMPVQPQIPYLKLSGIVYSLKDSYCIINDRITSTGDNIQGATLESISADEVI